MNSVLTRIKFHFSRFSIAVFMFAHVFVIAQAPWAFYTKKENR